MSQSKAQLLSPNGNFGIGTDTPQRDLVVYKPTSDSILSLAASSTEQAIVLFGDSDNDAIGQIRYDNTDNSMAFRVNISERLRITSDGKVGIGTDNPLDTLHIGTGSLDAIRFGNATFGYKMRANVSSTNDFGFLIEDKDGNDLYRAVSASGTNTEVNTHRFYTSGTERFRITATGRIEQKTNNEDIDMDSAANGQLKLDGNGYNAAFALNAEGLNIYNNSANRAIIFGTDETERVRINSAGNVGIGTDNPESRLHVYGTHNSHIRMTNTSDDALDLIGDANRSSAGVTILGMKGRWNGTEVSRITFQTGTDTTDKDDGNILFHTKSSGSSIAQRLCITSAGLVGINTDSPQRRLDVLLNNEPAARLGGSTYAIEIGQLTTNSSPGFNAIGGSSMLFKMAGNEAMRINNDLHVGINENNPQSPLHITVPAGDFTAATFEKASTDDVAIELKNSQGSMFVGLDGGENFHVAAGADLNNASNARFCVTSAGSIGLMGTNNVGSNNQVLTSQGSGNAVEWRGVNAAFYGEQDTEHSVSNVTWTVVKNFATNAINTTGWSESTGIFTANADTAGVYYVFGQGGIDDLQSTDVVRVGISKNNATPSVYAQGRNFSGGAQNVTPSSMVAGVVSLANGDTVRMKIYHNEGTSETTEKNRCFFGGYRLSV